MLTICPCSGFSRNRCRCLCRYGSIAGRTNRNLLCSLTPRIALSFSPNSLDNRIEPSSLNAIKQAAVNELVQVRSEQQSIERVKFLFVRGTLCPRHDMGSNENLGE